MQLYRAGCYFVGHFLLILRLLFIFISFILFYTTSKSVICYGFPFILLKISLKKIYVVCARQWRTGSKISTGKTCKRAHSKGSKRAHLIPKRSQRNQILLSNVFNK